MSCSVSSTSLHASVRGPAEPGASSESEEKKNEENCEAAAEVFAELLEISGIDYCVDPDSAWHPTVETTRLAPRAEQSPSNFQEVGRASPRAEQTPSNFQEVGRASPRAEQTPSNFPLTLPGTPAAQLLPDMSPRASTDQIAEPALQFLPDLPANPADPADWNLERSPSNDLSFELPNPPEFGVPTAALPESEFSPSPIPELEVPALAAAEIGSEDSFVSESSDPNLKERTELSTSNEPGLWVISQKIREFKQGDLHSLTFILKPDPDTELFLRMIRRPEGVEAQLTFEKGNWDCFKANLPQLEDKLTEQGVRLSVRTHLSSSFSFGRPDRAPFPLPVAPEETLDPALAAPAVVHARARRSSWEYWA